MTTKYSIKNEARVEDRHVLESVSYLKNIYCKNDMINNTQIIFLSQHKINI